MLTSRLPVVLEPVPVEVDRSPSPELLPSDSWGGPTGVWWAGAVPDRNVRAVHGPAGRLEVRGAGRLRKADDLFYPAPHGERQPVTGLVEGVQVTGCADQPGARGFLKQLTAVSRERRRMRMVLDDGREWWLRAAGAMGLEVRDGERRVVGRRHARRVELAAGTDARAQLAAVLLLTAFDRDGLLVFGRVG
ncbi:hypothetical protein DQ244_16660 [Blastococcus sp. TBT05-19]|uniref:hypothetical protein n=1 Tax=Blastococcus sp. TBT05-19 TaxID=2250581 RepID=UPI000DEA6F58|nr:hypothetical protein [Blastococcus sp. TBT05-19]RBY88173.1 hypothetical protein DQ244_16660 [Blastococcus sp. TBT05-19]